MAILKIHSVIETSDNVSDLRYMGYDGVCYKDVDEFLQGMKDDDEEIEIRLHCEGGVCTEGWAIYDRLRASGKRITAIVEGVAASMATIILMAAPKERRKAYENATLLVHNPYTFKMGGMTADDLRKAADDMQREQDRILDLYVERCGCDREEMQSLMNEDKPIDTKRAMEMGLIGEIITPASARGIINHNNRKGMETTEVKTSIFDKMLRKLGFKSIEEVDEEALDAVDETEEGVTDVLCMELSAADGSVVTVERESGVPQVGDKASPDGEFEMPDGRVIVIEEGVITDIKTDEEETAEDAAEEVDEVQALRDEVESLKAQLEEAQKMAKTKEEMRILNAVKMAGGEDVLKKVASGYVPETRKRDGREVAARAEERAESPMRMEIEARKKGEWNKK